MKQLLAALCAPMILAGAVGCRTDRAIESVSQQSSDVILDCMYFDFATASDAHHILRIASSGGKAEDLAFTPAHEGTAQIGASDYLVEFPTGWMILKFRINRYTGEGSRELVNPERPGFVAAGDHSSVKCQPFRGKPL